ncbi:hypothetical protein [Glaciihabitans sp. dw_435]|uniref:hypothetical protein n=1 Tax=Glaciihabitans sp. dw_435 TaxID=2720081 RepID=UPI001BD50402|nr:hypothetical protein [Glaciihabitans sp. dw_435]
MTRAAPTTDVGWLLVLSNRIWVMPQRDRAADPAASDVLYRCGSQAGKVAVQLPVDTSEHDFDAATAGFVTAQVAEYRAMRRSKQKNPARLLKKYFDREQIQLIDDGLDARSDEELAASLV